MAKQKVTVDYSGDKSFLEKVNDLFEEQIRLVGATEDDVKDLSKSYKRVGTEAQKGFGKAEKEMKGLGDTAKKVRNVIIAAVAIDKITDAGRAIINTRAEFQKFEAVLKNTLGSNSEAQKALQDIAQFASETPFSVAELTDSFVKLANQGFKPTVDELSNLGDLASSTGKNFDQLAEAIIDAQVGEFERLKEFGIRASKEGENVRFTFKGVETQVKNTDSAIRDYIVSLGDVTGVSGSMAAISRTIGGQLSNLGDNVDDLSNVLGERLEGAISGVIGALSSLIGWFADLFRIPLSEKLEEERITMIALGESIQDTTLDTESRAQAVTELIQLFPEYFSGLSTEASNYGEIAERIATVNKLLEAKRDLQAADEIIAEAEEEREEARVSRLKARIEAQKLVAEAQKDSRIASQLENKSLQEQLQVIKDQLPVWDSLNLRARAIGLIVNATEDNFKDAAEEARNVADAAKDIKDNIDPEALGIEKSFGIIEETFNRIKTDVKFVDVGNLEQAKEEAESAIRAVDNFTSISAADQEEIFERLNERFAELVPIVESRAKQSASRAAKAGKSAVDQLNKDLERLRKKLEDLKFDEALDIVGGADTERGIELLRERAIKEIELERGFNRLKLEEQQEFRRLINLEFDKLQEDRINKQRMAEQGVLDSIKEFKEKQLQQNLEIIQSDSDALELLRLQELDKELQAIGANQEERERVRDEFRKRELEANVFDAEQRLMATRALGQETLDAEIALAEARLALNEETNNQLTEQNQAKAEADMKIEEARAESFAKTFESVKGLLNEAIKNQTAAFVIDKAIAAAEIVLNLQKEIALIGATLGPAAPPFIAGAKIRAGIGLATVAATTISGARQLAEGEIDIKGPGTETSDSIPAMLSKGESVMTAKETKMFKPLLEGIRNKRVDPSMANALVGFGGERQLNITEEGIAKAMSNEIKSNGLFTKFSFDRKGFTKSVISGVSETQYLNDIYD